MRENESSSSNLHLIGVYGISRREGRISVGGRVEVFTECVVFFPACFFRHEASSRVPDTPRFLIMDLDVFSGMKPPPG